MPSKPLTQDELDIMEELDAYNRARVGMDRIDFSACCQCTPHLVTPNDIIKVINSLVRRGYIGTARYGRKIYVTELGQSKITRTKTARTDRGVLELVEVGK